jgi:hypothetical protein
MKYGKLTVAQFGRSIPESAGAQNASAAAF